VVSLGILDRLALVLMREFQVEKEAAETLVRAIGGVASFGLAGDHPHVLVGGGVYPMRDEEDRHVLEVAVAGKADLLVTATVADFEMADIVKVGDGTRIQLHPRPAHTTLVIVRPDQASDRLGSGMSPLAAVECL